MGETTCGNCGLAAEEGETLNHCARCKIVSYCSRACQVHHWKNGHKKTCQAASEREEDTVKKQMSVSPKALTTKKKTSAAEPRKSGKSKKKEKARKSKVYIDGTEQEPSFGSDEDCRICLDKLENPVRLRCGHHCTYPPSSLPVLWFAPRFTCSRFSRVWSYFSSRRLPRMHRGAAASWVCPGVVPRVPGALAPGA